MSQAATKTYHKRKRGAQEPVIAIEKDVIVILRQQV